MIRRKKLYAFNILLLISVNFIIFALCFTRVQVIGFFMILSLYFFRGIGKKNFFSRFGKCIALTGWPIMFILACISPFVIYAEGQSELSSEINDVTADRAGLNMLAFTRYGVSMLGNKIENEDGAEYFYIDSGYVYALVGYGIVFSVLVLYLYSKTFWKAFKNKNYMIYCALLVFMVLSVFNDFFMQLNYNPLLLYLFADDKAKVWKKKYCTITYPG